MWFLKKSTVSALIRCWSRVDSLSFAATCCQDSGQSKNDRTTIAICQASIAPKINFYFPWCEAAELMPWNPETFLQINYAYERFILLFLQMCCKLFLQMCLQHIFLGVWSSWHLLDMSGTGLSGKWQCLASRQTFPRGLIILTHRANISRMCQDELSIIICSEANDNAQFHVIALPRHTLSQGYISHLCEA